MLPHPTGPNATLTRAVAEVSRRSHFESQGRQVLRDEQGQLLTDPEVRKDGCASPVPFRWGGRDCFWRMADAREPARPDAMSSEGSDVPWRSLGVAQWR
jgi:hypothetical protein